MGDWVIADCMSGYPQGVFTVKVRWEAAYS